MHDGWSKNGTHYLAIYASYMKPVVYTTSKNDSQREELSLPLLSESPIAKRDSEGEIESGHSIRFDTESRVRQLEHIFLLLWH